MKDKRRAARRRKAAVGLAGLVAVIAAIVWPPHGELPGALLSWPAFVYVGCIGALVALVILVGGVCERLINGETPSEIGPQGIKYPSRLTGDVLRRIIKLEARGVKAKASLSALKRAQASGANKAKANETKVQKQLDKLEQDLARLERRCQDGDW